MTEAEVTVRPATPADIDQVVAIERASFSDPWSPRAFRDLIGRDDVLFDVAVRPPARREGEVEAVAGFVIVYVVDSEGDLANIAIHASQRGRGEGRRLLRHAVAAVQARGVYFLYLEVRESNTAARALYESEGFVEVGRRSKYYVRPVEDALILRKGLGGAR
ncbi:MAG TPA: ribosomal protein S18-alanine N-acetyltransferase [Gemmatimonadaceae bacterium]|nr:ribosomal protein S18-alanine N-acetyltransferase [Gemmatimonadaceae bacterium]